MLIIIVPKERTYSLNDLNPDVNMALNYGVYLIQHVTWEFYAIFWARFEHIGFLV